jgi:chromosome partitioning protein
MKTLVITSEKGGVGKTAVTTQLALYVATRLKMRVLVLDFDSQNNATNALTRGGEAALAPFTGYDVFLGNAGAVPDSPFVLIPEGNRKTLNLESQPEHHGAYANNVVDFLDSAAPKFDLCLIDTNPSPDIRKTIALVVANYLLVPIALTQESIEGVKALLYSEPYGYEHIKRTYNAGLELIGIMPVMVETTPIQRRLLQDLTENEGTKSLLLNDKGVPLGVLKRQAIQEAQELGAFIGDLDKSSTREAWRGLKFTFDAVVRELKLQA